jgi:hypothetical protein
MERAYAQQHPARNHLLSRSYALRKLLQPACPRAAVMCLQYGARRRRLLATRPVRRVRADLHLHREHIARRSKHHDLAIVASKVPHSVICLLSALRFHRLGTQLPGEVWVAIGEPVNPRSSSRHYALCVSMARPSPRVSKSIASRTQHVRVYSVPKTIADLQTGVAWRFRRAARERSPPRLLTRTRDDAFPIWE